MLFEVERSGKNWILTPYCLRDDCAGADERSVYLKEGRIAVNYKLQAEHMSFARAWNRCLEQQGYIAAFERSTFIWHFRHALQAEFSVDNHLTTNEWEQRFDRALETALAHPTPTA